MSHCCYSIIRELILASRRLITIVIALTVGMSQNPLFADAISARGAMENSSHPLLQVTTSRGDIYLEMFADEAPNNVSQFIALAEGEVEIFDAATATSFRPRFYDGMRFHRVLPQFLIQAGSPVYHPLGAPEVLLADEINADALGLQQAMIMNPDGSFNPLLDIASKADLDARVLQPLYRAMGISTVENLQARQAEVLQTLQQMTVKRAYENLGFRYRTTSGSHPVSRGTVALANQGPNTNGPEFFISLVDANWLTGKYTVIGKVVEGMEVVDTIGQTAIDPIRFNRASTVIYSITRIN